VPVLLAIDRDTDGATLHRQIYDALRAAILEGRWGAGSRLPGSRVFADDLGVSRTTILTAYDQLKADGYIEGRAGGGTRVSLNIPHLNTGASHANNGVVERGQSAVLSSLGTRMIAAYGDISARRQTDRPVPFELGVPALDTFPVATWARLTARRWRTTPRAMLAPADGPGFPPLREAISEYVVKARALRCTPDQIVITAGSQQAIDLIARMLLDPGDAVWVEEYGYRPARASFMGVGACPIQIPVDDEGLDIECGRQLAPHARLAFVTPACEAPFGVTMSLSRRIALLEWAHRTGAWIVEDDYNGELRYEGRSLPALQGFEHPGARRVIYLRTFSKTLFPALRLGYAVLPLELVDAFVRARLVADRHSPTSEQAVLADFITGGHFARHIRDMQNLYAGRQRTFLELASRELGGLLKLRPAAAGIRLVGNLKPGVSDQQVATEAARRGVLVEPLSPHRATPSDKPGLVMGYVPFQTAEIRHALAQLADAIRSVGPATHSV
jgi:GntR family transcriptional regulator/MocR family aminotransferase